MKIEYLAFLCCPECQSDFSLEGEVEKEQKIRKGTLQCTSCQATYSIKNFIPRFVNNSTYADSFGHQWNAFAKSQLDTIEFKESSIRFDTELGWRESDLVGKTVFEIGSGAGRFIDIVSKRNAKLALGIDITDAVDASQDNLGDRENVFFIQADVFKLPVKKNYFDFGYSIGVSHHTPDPEKAFNHMIDYLNVGGKAGLSLYEISLYERPNRNTMKVVTLELLWAINMFRAEFFRQIMTRLPHRLTLAYCKSIIPLLHYLNKVPIIRYFRYLLPSTCYRNLPVICSMVDTMDTYATKIVHQYRAKDLFRWFAKQGLDKIFVHNSRPGWVSLKGGKELPG